jgi:sporulation protein YlmC with PRC-barrel domain
MNTPSLSSPLRRFSALLAVSMGVAVSGLRADSADPSSNDRANIPRQDSLSASANRDGAHLVGEHDSRLVLSQARLASDLRGRDVYDAQGEKIGSVADVIVDINSGRAPYALVSSGGVLGMGARDRAVPLGALKSRVSDGKPDGYSLNVSKERWAQAPTLERKRLSALENEIHGRNLHNVYGQTWTADVREPETANPSSPGANPPDRGRKEADAKTGDLRGASGTREPDAHARGQQLVLASELTGKALVIRTADREAGSIDEIVLAREGTRAAILLDPAGELSRDGRKYVIAFDRVLRDGGGRYVTDLTTADFEATAATVGDAGEVVPGAVRLWPGPDERTRVDR